ncbi:methylated-DNA--[protein]-cysteine S-methyltransferase [Humitalea sp. 24SJ18S-53]|uniref:methylated-DNA--[protein]-cysteine S-methyltransferase n=1 Tax=Humitalea sp. 24SJ18S-53 TaxID=3422307 RepID=UPI003D669D6F
MLDELREKAPKHGDQGAMRQASFHTPLGEITLFSSADGLTALEWGRGGGASLDTSEHPLLAEAKRQFDAYFDGQLSQFDLPLAPDGSPFQQRVWACLQTIPLGQTMSYGEVAAVVGTAARAIGQANARNPLPILIPCHRVTAGQGRLGGYSGGDGVQTKKWLLAHEDRMSRGVFRLPNQGTTR